MKLQNIQRNYIRKICSMPNENILNSNAQSCINCKFFKTLSYNQSALSLGKCENFGIKNIISNKITYDYATHCRSNKDKCGGTAKYFELEENLDAKIWSTQLIYIIPEMGICIPFAVLVIISFK